MSKQPKNQPVQQKNTQLNIDISTLLRTIENTVCPECHQKIANLIVPITQTMTVKDLIGEQ